MALPLSFAPVARRPRKKGRQYRARKDQARLTNIARKVRKADRMIL
jgi:hypothetical protein